MALLNSARYQQKLRRYHDKHVRKRDLNVGDLVLRRRQSNQRHHKLTPPWEGPYVVVEVLKLGTYKPADEKGAVFTNVCERASRPLVISVINDIMITMTNVCFAEAKS